MRGYGDCTEHLYDIFHAGNGYGIRGNDNLVTSGKGKQIGGKGIHKTRMVAIEKTRRSFEFFKRFFIGKFYLQEYSLVKPD